MRELTKAEEQIMQILWKTKKGFVKEILEYFPEPKPAYNTVSTIIRILQEKGFVSHKAYGRTHEYFPLISKDQYKEAYMGSIMKDYFSNSYEKMLSFFTKSEKISMSEMEDIMQLMREEIAKQKKK